MIGMPFRVLVVIVRFLVNATFWASVALALAALAAQAFS